MAAELGPGFWGPGKPSSLLIYLWNSVRLVFEMGRLELIGLNGVFEGLSFTVLLLCLLEQAYNVLLPKGPISSRPIWGFDVNSHSVVSNSLQPHRAHQALLSLGFSRQEYWSGMSFPSPGDLPRPGIKPVSSALAEEFFTTVPPGNPIRV